MLTAFKPSRNVLCGILFFVAFVRLLTIGLYPVMDNTESRYAEIAREMVTTGNWITPQLEPGLPFWGKPPLSFWLTAVSYKVFGINEFGARFPSVLLGFLTVYLVYLLGWKLKDKDFGLISAVVLSTIGVFFVNSGTVMTDPALAFAVTLSLVSFALTFLESNSKIKKIWGYLFFAGLGLSFLAKGPIGWVLTGLPVFLWTVMHNKWKDVIANLPWISGGILMLAIALPWYFIAESKTPGFLEYFFIGEHWQRFTVKGWQGDLYGSGHAQPKGMIWLFAVPATMPWTVIFAGMLIGFYKKGKRIVELKKYLWISYLVLWFTAPMIIFTLAGNILVPYVAPGLAAFAVLLAFALSAFQFPQEERVRWYHSQRAVLFTAGFVPVVVLLGAFTVLPKEGDNHSQLALVKVFSEQRQDGDGLIYIQTKPQSADFYSQGKAEYIEGLQKEEVSEKLYDQRRDFFVVEENFEGRLPQEFFPLTEKLAEHREYRLYREIQKK